MIKNIIIVLFTVCCCCLKMSGQSFNLPNVCDTTISWNFDTASTIRGLPFNQYVCFEIKSARLDLSKISSVWVLKHHKKKNAEESLKHYSKTNNYKDIQENFYRLEIPFYDEKLKILKTKMVGSKSLRAITGADYVFQPNHTYSILLLNDDPDEKGQKLLSQIKNYLKLINNNFNNDPIRNADSIRLRRLVITSLYNIYSDINSSSIGTAFLTDYTDFNIDSTGEKLINEYSSLVFESDIKIDSIKNLLDRLSKGFTTRCLQDSIIFQILKSFSIYSKCRECKLGNPCAFNKCKLLELLTTFFYPPQSAKTTDSLIINGYLNIVDLTNILFKLNPSINEEARLKNIDTSLFYLQSLKTYITTFFVHNCIWQVCENNIYSNNQLDSIKSRLKKYQNCIDTVIDKLQTSKTFVGQLNSLNKERKRAIKEAGFFKTTSVISSLNTHIYGLEERTKTIITPVFGYAFYGFQQGFTSFTPYLGLVISLAPLTDHISFQNLKRKTILQRTSFLTGITLASLKEVNKRDDLFGNKTNLITGFGFKLNHIITLNGGIIMFREEDPNPFVDTKKIATTPYASFSINLKLKTLWEGFTNLIPL